MLVLALFSTGANAQRSLILAQKGLPYSEQQTIYEGAGNVFPAGKLKNYWNAGRHITSMTYGDHGWFFIFSAKSGIVNQRSYDSFDFFSEDLFYDMQRQGFCLTDMAKGSTSAGNKWCFIYSSFEKQYKQQFFIDSDWTKVKNWMGDQWQDGYFITYVYYDGLQWYVVSTQDDDYIEQGYFWADSYDSLKSKASSQAWKKGYSLDFINYGPGGYLVMYSKKHSVPDNCEQRYAIEPNDLIGKVKELWSAGLSILRVGSLSAAVTNLPNADMSRSSYFNTMTQNQKRHHNPLQSASPVIDNGPVPEHQSIETVFGQIADIDGRIHQGIYTMTGDAYCGNSTYDMGFAPLMKVQIFFKKMIVNGIEYPFIGWSGKNLRCYGKTGSMFTVSDDLSVDYRTTLNGSPLVFGMVKGNLSSVYNYRNNIPSSVIDVEGDYVQDSEDPEILKHNRELLKAQWTHVVKVSSQKIAAGEDAAFSNAVSAFAKIQIKSLSK